ncbi:ankyrin repeat domain-containing protein [Treponema zioleckii]|uniref:ankyrin repeat domain-containing protein n=1 Tax=Treponema zioleckii TaxID=331680 RepID=UPI00168AA824|nr:ankyrin repeat domain-containing protein [Treponema zioleckii]
MKKDFHLKNILTILLLAGVFFAPIFAAENIYNAFKIVETGTEKEIKKAFRTNEFMAQFTRGDEQETLLHAALKANRNLNIIELLLNAGISTKTKMKNGITPLMYACQYESNIDVIEKIIKTNSLLAKMKKNKILQKDSNGKNSFDYAEKNKNSTEVIKLLEKYAENPNKIEETQSEENIPAENQAEESDAKTISTEENSVEEKTSETNKQEEPTAEEDSPTEASSALETEPEESDYDEKNTKNTTQSILATEAESIAQNNKTEDTINAAEKQEENSLGEKETIQLAELNKNDGAPSESKTKLEESAPKTSEIQTANNEIQNKNQLSDEKVDFSVLTPSSENEQTKTESEKTLSEPSIEEKYAKIDDDLRQGEIRSISNYQDNSYTKKYEHVKPILPIYKDEYLFSRADEKAIAETKQSTPKNDDFKQTLLADDAVQEQKTEKLTNGKTALMKAVLEGDIPAIENILKNGANINALDDDGWSALMYAARYQNDYKVTELLLKNNADFYIKNKYGISALTLAAGYLQNPKIVSLLLEKYERTNREVRNSFIFAISQEVSEAVLEEFYKKLGSVDIPFEGRTALMYAAAWNRHTKTISWLLSKSASITIKDSSGRNAFDYAKENIKIPHDEIYWSLNQKK